MLGKSLWGNLLFLPFNGLRASKQASTGANRGRTGWSEETEDSAKAVAPTVDAPAETTRVQGSAYAQAPTGDARA